MYNQLIQDVMKTLFKISQKSKLPKSIQLKLPSAQSYLCN